MEGVPVTFQRVPDSTRPTISTGAAAKLLRCSIDTVKNRIRRGDFGEEAGQHPNGRWWLYEDLLVPDGTRQLRQEIVAVRRQLEETAAEWAADRARWADERAVLEARHRADQYKIDSLLAINAATLSAGESYKGAADEALSALGKFKSAADQWIAVGTMWRDLMAQQNVPDDPGGIATTGLE